MSDEKKIFIDDDWKSQVAAEKESLKQEATAAQQSAAGTPATDGAPAIGTPADTAPHEGGPAGSEPSAEQSATGPQMQMPPVSLEMLVTTLATEAMVALGQFPNPATQEVSVSIEHASYAIDMLGMLEEKTKGNLTPAEATMMTDLLHQLRMMFVAVQQAPPNA